MATNSNTYTIKSTPGYILYNHIYCRSVEIRSTTVVTPTKIYSHKVTNRYRYLPYQPVHPNGFSVLSQVCPGTLHTLVPATQAHHQDQGLPSHNLMSVAQETPMGWGFSSPTGTAMSSQGSSAGPAAARDGRTDSLPTQKHEPYVCPTCNYSSETSQLFASHVKSHYMEDTSQDRHDRLAARVHKRPRTMLQGNNGGATVGPSNGKRAKVMK